MDHIHENINEYNPNKKHEVLIVYDDISIHVLSNKKRNQIFILLFLLQSYVLMYRKILD